MDRFVRFQNEITMAKPSTLYHGSPKRLKTLHPKDSGYRGNHVFATNRYSFALAYAANQWNDYDINQSRVDGKMILTEIIQGRIKEIFDCPGYIHIVPGKSFYQISGSEFASDVPVNVISVKFIPNVLDELKKMPDVKILFYPELPSFIKSREIYIQELDRLYKLPQN